MDTHTKNQPNMKQFHVLSIIVYYIVRTDQCVVDDCLLDVLLEYKVDTVIMYVQNGFYIQIDTGDLCLIFV